ncbi:MAG TPA: hypothetical protein VFP65_10165 [Anaeromyxobacteraceae bacterium]|nr:hypothetical protein [Anaeromyxobacteraceae bacterium]
MKLVLRAMTALALVGLAAPAFPCGDKTETHASTKASSDSKGTVAKAEKKDAKKDKAAAKTATN